MISNQAMILFHSVAGAALLVFYWRTLFSRKGSRNHKRLGRTYLMLLVPLMISIIPISLAEAQQQGPARLLQLVYLGLVVATAGWTAWRAVVDRGDPDRYRGTVFCILAGCLFGAGVALLILGITRSNVLTVGFSVIGVVYGGAMLGFLGREPTPRWWLDWHLNGVALLFAATHASFIGLIARHGLPGLAGEVMHGLTQLGTIAFAYGFRQWLGWRYGQFGATSVAMHGAAAAAKSG
jgi:hypothetical protein